MTPDVNPIPVRRMDFDASLADVPKYFAGDGNIVTSHFISVLSALFPDGEDFFVKSVRHYRKQIDDPVLQKQISGFIGQESIHGREHRDLNDHLAEHGFTSNFVSGMTKRGLGFRWKYAPAIANLALTAALEHFTATLAEIVLSEQAVRDLVAHQGVHDIFLWHALEEAEHKSVAFDVYKTVGGSERLRVYTMKFTRSGLCSLLAVQTLISVLLDRDARRSPRRVLADFRAFRRNPLISRETWETLKLYDQPDFHPSDTGGEELLAEWRERLFGVDGTLNDHLPARAA